MNVLLIGGGGREHAIAKKIKESKKLTDFYAIPGNPGISKIAKVISENTNVENIVKLAKENKVDLIICGPEQPLVEGLYDLAKDAGIPVFGPSKKGARLEGSKIYSKEIMYKYQIPTAAYKSFYDLDSCEKYLETRTLYPLVIKADGLAAGKGVKIAFSKEESLDIVRKYMKDKMFGASSESLIIEDFMTGEEMSALYITDGKTFLPLLAAKDYKKVYDDDKGDNTGGMGSYAPHNSLTGELQERVDREVIQKMRLAFEKENIDYKGVLYVGLMLTDEGPKVVEFNCRFGDPETQVILPLIDNDLLEVMFAAAKGELSGVSLKWKSGYAACVVIASGGYPDEYKKGLKINFKIDSGDFIHAGTKFDGNDIVTNGGRVLNAVALGETKKVALENAYKLVSQVSFEGAFNRKDIGK
jgi:phosphoribosylamine---glycine ligase